MFQKQKVFISTVPFGQKNDLPIQLLNEKSIEFKINPLGQKLKEGTLSSDDHDGLSYSISKDWRKLGRRLGILNEDLENIDETRREFSDKADQMLQLWEQRNASNATYRVLCQALCHKFLNRRDLAERFCFH